MRGRDLKATLLDNPMAVWMKKINFATWQKVCIFAP
jgi:hypothetical protein